MPLRPGPCRGRADHIGVESAWIELIAVGPADQLARRWIDALQHYQRSRSKVLLVRRVSIVMLRLQQ